MYVSITTKFELIPVAKTSTVFPRLVAGQNRNLPHLQDRNLPHLQAPGQRPILLCKSLVGEKIEAPPPLSIEEIQYLNSVNQHIVPVK